MGLPFLKIGDIALQPLQMLPNSNFTAVARKKVTIQRSQNGTLYSQRSYEKYSVKVSGVAQNLFPELRLQYQRDDFIDLYSIATRKEQFTAPGNTAVFLTSRRIRLDDNALPLPVIHQAGATLSINSGATLSSVSAGGTQGVLTITGATPALGVVVDITYYPIINGQITEMESNWDWVKGDENWSLVFEES